MSRGRPRNSRRSMPTTRSSPSRWSRRASSLPRRPAIPVTTIFCPDERLGSGGSRLVTMGSPEDVPSLLEAGADEGVNLVAYLAHLLFQHLVFIVGIPGEPHRIAEVDAVLHRIG